MGLLYSKNMSMALFTVISSDSLLARSWKLLLGFFPGIERRRTTHVGAHGYA